MTVENKQLLHNIIVIVFFIMLFCFLFYDLYLQYMPKYCYISFNKKVITIVKDKDRNDKECYYVCEGKYKDLNIIKSKRSYYILNKGKKYNNGNYFNFFSNPKNSVLITTNMTITNCNANNNKLIVLSVVGIKTWDYYYQSNFQSIGSINTIYLKKRISLDD